MATAPELLPYGRIREDLFRPLSGVSRNYILPIIHLGRAWLFYWLFPYPNSRLLWPNFRSPLLWDVTAIITYLTGSVIYLYLPLIPDLAQLAEHAAAPWRRFLYRTLALGWTGSDRQWHALERAMKLM